MITETQSSMSSISKVIKFMILGFLNIFFKDFKTNIAMQILKNVLKFL